LTGILGKISLAKLDIDSKTRSYSLIGDAENAVLRAQGLTRQLLTFAKGNALVKEPVSVSDLVTETVNIHLAGTKALASVFIDPDTANLFADKGQLSQVIGNLLVNAVQSMKTGGTIVINAANEVIPTGSSLNVEPGNYVRIDVIDTGTGIPEEDLPKVFDPFFTTKKKGNGLGLTTSHMIVRRHSGAISVKSKPGDGSTFSIHLPASPLEIESRRERISHMSNGGKRILLMDDDEIILSTVAEIIKYLGYEVETARDGSEAIERYKDSIAAKRPYDAVIMDLTVPGGVGGKEAMQELLVIDPSVKAIVSSGYSNDPIMADYVKHGFRALIAKPYRIEELSEVLRKVIEEK
ncbi:MAG TPA: ATP-binding protein, partial [Spirochaetota bacterium]